MRLKIIITSLFLLLAALMPVGSQGPNTAQAQFGNLPGMGGIGGLVGGGGGGDRVHIVGDTSQPTILNTINTRLIELRTALTGTGIDELVLKEKVLDPVAWNMAKQLQQQLTGNLLKWLGGQLPGQNGQVPFVQNYGEHYGTLADTVAGQFIFEERLSGLCSPEEDFLAKERVFDSHVQARNEDRGAIFQCIEEEYNDPEDSALDQAFFGMMTCSDVSCAGFKAEHELAIAQANAYANEKQILDYSRGMKAQKICRTVTEGNATSTDCGLVNPPFVAAETVTDQLIRIPGDQLLQMDEFNEIVSNLMSNLTNQALTGLTGVLGLTGNPNYSVNVFGEGGNLSYVDALAQDDISNYQTGTANPIKEALQAEKDNEAMQKEILDEIKSIEDKLAADTAAFSGCFDLTLTSELRDAKTTASTSLAIASTSIAILTTLDQQYASSTNASERGAILSAFMSYKNQNLFHTPYQNHQFRVTYLEFTFAQMADKFRYDIAVERQSCGGSFDYQGVLTPPGTASSTSRNNNSP